MTSTSLHPIRFLVYTCLLFLCSSHLFGQTATVVNNANWPRYESFDQQSVDVLFNDGAGGAVTLTGSSTMAQWSVTVNGTPVTIIATVPFTGVTTYPIINGAAGVVRVAFDASVIAGHPAWVLPGDVVKVTFNNTGGTLKTGVSGNSATNFAGITCKNNYAATCVDVNFLSYGNASSPTQCAPVDTKFWRWTYRYSLRWRNSSKFAVGNENLIVKWNDPGNTTTGLKAWYSDPGGLSWFSNVTLANSLTTIQSGYSPPATPYPEIFLTYRTSFNPVTGLVDGTNPFIYPKGSGLCNFNAVAYPFNGAYFGCNTGQNLKSQNFVSFDWDNQTPGTLNIQNTIPPVTPTSDQVCLGTNVGVKFNDLSTFNCMGNGTLLTVPTQGAFNSPVNSAPRWIRIIYGGQNSSVPANNIPNIVVNGFSVTGAGGALNASLVANPVISAAYNLAPPVNTPAVPATVNGYVPTGAGGPNVPDANGVIQLNVPITATTSGFVSQLITTSSPLGQVVGQKFYVTIQYWNACNPYPGNNPVEFTGTVAGQYVQIVTAPAPLSSAGQAVCYSAANNINPINFSTNSSIGGSRTGVNWYKSNPQVGGAKITNPNGANSLTFPANAYTSSGGIGTFAINNTNGGYYSLWATQLAASGPSTCESTPVEVVIFQQPNILTNTPSITSGPVNVCNNTTQTYTSSAPTTPKTLPVNTFTNTGIAPENGAINFVTDDFWSQGFGVQVSLSAPQGTSTNATFNLSPQPATFTTNNISVNLQYTGSPVVNIISPVTNPAPPPALPAPYSITPLTNCPNNTTNLAVNVYGVSNGGSISVPSQTICEGSIPSVVKVNGIRGTVQNWQMQVNGGGFSTNVALGTGTTANITAATVPIVGGAQTTYQFYAVIQNGVCSPVNSPTATIIVNPRPTNAVLSGTNTICKGGTSNLVVTITGGVGPYSVVYSDGSVNTTVNGYVSASNIPVSPTVNTTYSLISITDTNGCTPSAMSPATATVTVRNLSAVLSSTGPTSLCPAPNSTTVAFTITDNNGNALTSYTVNYQDNLGGTYTAGPGYVSAANATLTNIASTRTYSITSITDPLGCTTNPNTGNVTVTIGSIPTAATLSGPASVCQNATANLSLAITGGVAPYTVQIFNGVTTNTINNYVSGNNIPIPTAVAGSVTYNVTLVKDNCNAVLAGAITNNPLTVTVNPLPLSNNSTPVVVCSQTNLNINTAANITNGVASTFAWTAAYTGGMTGPASGTGNITGVVVNKTSSVQTATYTVTPTSVTGSCPGANFTVTQQVNPEPVSANQTLPALCSPATVNINPQTQGVNQPGGNSVASTFAWTGSYGALTGGVASGTGNITGFILTNSTGAAINAVFTVTPTAVTGSCAGSSFTITLPVNPLAALPGGLPANDTKCAGKNSSFSIAGATGPGLTYQWQVSTDGGATWNNLSNGAPYSNVTTATMNITGVTNGLNNYKYRAVLTTTGSCTINSPAATLTVNPLPTSVDPTPALCEDVFGGGSHANVDLTSYNASVTNAPTVVWYNDAGHISLVGTPSNVTVTNGKIYYFVATSAATCVNSGTLTFTVNPLPVATNQNYSYCEDHAGATPIPPHSNTHAGIDLTSYNATIAGGSMVNRTVAWYSDAGLTTLIPTPTNYTLAPVLPATSVTVYTKVTNTVTSCTNSSSVNLTVLPRPIDNPLSGNTSVCTGSSILLYQLDPSKNPGSNYTWSVVGTPPGDVALFGGGGTNSSNFFVLLKFPSATGTVAINVFETLNGCTGNTNPMTITVNSAPAPNSITGAVDVCTNQTAVPYSVASPNGSSTYTWTVTPDASNAGSVTANGSAINVNFGIITPITISVTETAISGCVGGAASIGVNVHPRPAMTSAATSTVCSGQVPTLAFTSNIASTYAWTVTNITGSITGVVNGQNGVGNLSSTFTAGVLRNQSGAVGSVTFNVTPTASAAPNCTGTTQSVVLTVNPEPVLVTPQTATICSGSQVNYNILLSPLNLPAGTVYSWPVPTMSDASAQGSAVTNMNVPITDVLNNTSSAAITATYAITPVSGAGCIGTTRNVVVTVNPQPAINVVNPSPCSGNAIGVTFTKTAGSPAINNYNVTSIVVPGGLVASGSNAIIPANGVSASYISNDSYLNTTLNPLVVQYAVVPVTSAGCVGSSVTFNITINPQPSLSNTLDKTLCSELATGLTLSTIAGSVPATGYNITGISIAPGLVAGGSNAIVPAVNVAPGYLSADQFTNTGNSSLTVVYQVVPVSSLGCNGNPPKSITMTILPEPVVASGLNASVCSRGVTGLTLNTNGTSIAATSYNITARSIDVGLVAGGTNAVVPASGVTAAYLASDVFTNTTGAALTVKYTVVPVSASPCNGQPKIITITINPEPVMSSSLDGSICSSNAIGLVLNTNGTSVGAANYNITARAISAGLTPNVANAAVPVAGVPANYLSNDVYTNTGASPLTVTYTVVPVSSSGCLGVAKVITITINPEPVVSSTLDATVCSIVPIGLTLNTNGSSVAAANYNITAITIAGGLTAGSNAAIPASNVPANYLAGDTYSNTGTVPLTVVYTVVPTSAAGCLGKSKSITLTISPEPIVSNSLNTTVCSGAAINLTLNTNGTSVAAANYTISSVSVAPGLTAAGTNAVVPATSVVPTYLLNDKYTNTSNTSLPVVYTVVPLSAAGCPGPSKSITITINPEPVVSNALNNTVCSDVATGLTLNTNGTSVVASSYNITARTISGGLTPKGTNATVPAAGVVAGYLANDQFTNVGNLPLTVTYTVVPVSPAGCLGQPQSIIMTITPEPVLLPTLNNTVCSSTAINLTLNTVGTSVAASGYNITNLTLAAGLVASGSNVVVPATGVSNSYLVNDQYVNTTANQLAATYTVVPVSADGCLGNPVNVVITINPEPVVSNLLDNTVCSDAITNLILNTNGTSVAALNYNITARTIAGSLAPAGTNAIVPATGVGANYLMNDKFTNTSNAIQLVTYTVVPVSGATCLGSPKVITITINPKPVLSGTLNNSVCSNTATGLTLATNGVSVSAQNYNIVSVSLAGGLTPLGTNAAIPATGVNASYLASDVFINTGNSNLTVTYNVIPVSAAGCAGVSVPVVITIMPQPVMSNTLDATLCSSLPIGLTLNTNGTSVPAANYNITTLTVGGGLVAAGGNAAVPATGVVPGYLANDVYTNTTNAALTVNYTAIPVSAATCAGAPKMITITINPQPVVASGLDKSACSQANIALTLNTNGASVAAANYSVTGVTIDPGLTAAGTNVTIPTSSNVAANYLISDKYTNTGLTSGNVVYTVVPYSAANCQGQAKSITITINPEPVMATANQSVCSSAATGLSLVTSPTSVAAASFNIVSETIGGTLTASGTNATVPNTGVAASYLANDVFKNISNASQQVSYVVIPVSGSTCVGVAQTIKVTVYPEPVGSNVTDPKCAATLNQNLQSQVTNGVNSVFTYTVSSNNGGVPAAANRTVASSAPITDSYTNNTGTPATITYTVTPLSASNNCVGATFTYVVVISPTPVGAGSTAVALCSRTAININPQSNITNSVISTFSWTAVYDASLTGGVNSGTGNITGNLTNLTAGTLNATYTVTPSSGPCAGNTFVIVQPVNPEPVMDPSLAAKTICSNNASSPNPTNIVLNTNGISVSATSYNVSLVSQDIGLTGSPTTGAALGANGIKNDVYNNVGAVPLKVVYQSIPKSAAGCTGAPFQIAVTVNPEPVVGAITNTVCSKSTSAITLATNGSSVGATSYKLTAVSVPGTITAAASNVANLGLPQTGGVGLIANDKYTNTTNVSVNVVYSIAAISGSGCQGVPQSITLTINPEPILVPGLATVCSGLTSGIILGTQVGSAPIVQYNLKQIFVVDSLTAAGTNAGIGNYMVNNFLANDVFTNITKNSWQVTYTIAPVAAGNCVGNDYLVKLTVNPAPSLANLSLVVCSGSATGITLNTKSSSVVAASPNGYNITAIAIQPGLTQNAGNIGTPRNGVTNTEILGDKFTNATNGTQTVTYSVAPVSSAGCIGPVKTVVVTVEPTIKATITPASLTQSICSNNQTNIVMSSPSVPTTGAASISFSYTATSNIGGSLSGFTPSISNLPPGSIQDNLVNVSNAPGNVTYKITAVSNGAGGGVGCSSAAVNFVVTVDPLPKLIASPLISTVCSQVASNIALNSPTTPSAGTVQFNVISATPTGGITLTSPAVPVATYANHATIVDKWNNTTVSQQTVSYVLQPVISGGLGCVGSNSSITLNVNPLPVITATSQAPICSDSTVNISLSSNVIGTINTWSTSISPANSVIGAGGGSGDLILQSLRNNGNVPSTVTYTITPKAANCVNTPLVVNVTVNPTPTFTGLPLKQVVCYGAPLTIPLASPVTGVNYAWTTDPNNSGVPLAGSASGAGANSSATINVASVKDTLSFSSDAFSYYITPTGPAPTFCPGLQKTVSVQAGALMKAKFLNDSINNLCAGTKDFLQVQLNGQAPFTLVYNDGSNQTLTKVANFKAIAITPTSNSTYKLVSMMDNLGCAQPLNRQVVYNVYPKLTAAFTIGPVPQFSGGNSTVNFTNTSTPQDNTKFSYVWNFGVDSAPDSVNNVGPNFLVNYSSPGRKIISLTVTNLSPSASGLSCYTKMTTQSINILIAPVIAAFQATPPASCFPSDLIVTQNTSGGDQSSWQVTDSNNNIVAQSTAPLPKFSITQPGKYYISLTAIYSKTGQQNTLTQGPFLVYDKPKAMFLANPPTVYVPDSPMKLINNSIGGTEFNWDFGDGGTSTDFDPSYTYKFEGIFTITLISSNDHGGGVICRDTATQKIVAKQGGVAKIPNAFTPSTAGPSGGVSGGTNDANNYIFLPQVRGIEEFNLQIYDRWGNLIFESNNQTVGWDGYDQNGRLMHAGVYVYKLTLRLSDQQRTTQIGDVTLIR
ncbi:MAG: gliding motility-associated C-terminal domain-containing protein [Bacteroidetes bacterium]|nr:gliding motility-associated C-terminal domain-containing protein [Bacteroidota bacterium]